MGDKNGHACEDEMTYEYIGLQLDLSDLSELNALASVGWRVCVVMPHCVVLLERPLAGKAADAEFAGIMGDYTLDSGKSGRRFDSNG